jgi:hypothetical protein
MRTQREYLQIMDDDATLIDPGGYRFPPTYSNWLKTIGWKFTIFSSFSGPKLPGPFKVMNDDFFMIGHLNYN